MKVMKIRSVWAVAVPLVLVLALFGVAAPGPARAQDPGAQAVAVCPAPEALDENGVAVCVDRGAGGVYYDGDPIAICVVVNLPVIAIFPPPPAPLVRVTNSVDGGAPRVLLEDHFWSGERCITSTITPPLGHETIRAEVSGPATYVWDETHYTSLPHLVGGIPTLTLSYTDAQGPGTARIMPQGPDPASGGTAIAMTLEQNGVGYMGGGFVRPGELGGYVLDVTITGVYGDSYQLSGTLMHDQDRVRWRGQGRWWATWDRSITGEWSMAGGPFAEPAPQPQLSATVQLKPTTKPR